MSNVFISTEGEKASGKGGNGPEDDARNAVNALRSYGLIALYFGFATGFAFLLMYILIHAVEPSGPLAALFINRLNDAGTAQGVALFSADYFRNLGIVFLMGLVMGSVIAMIYNLLVVRRINLFGLESSMD